MLKMHEMIHEVRLDAKCGVWQRVILSVHHIHPRELQPMGVQSNMLTPASDARTPDADGDTLR